MKLGAKIRHIRENIRKLSKKELHTKLVAIFGKEAISYKSLIRIEKGENNGRAKSIHQIACGLNVDVKELLSGTDKNPSTENAILADIIRKNNRPGRFTYNDKTYLEILSSKKSSFITMELLLGPGSKTRKENFHEDIEMMVFVTKGSIIAHIYKETYILHNGDSIFFRGHLPHYFVNPKKRKSKAVIIQNPKTF